MTLPPEAQPIIDQLLRVLGLRQFRPEMLEVHFDRDGIAQDVKPTLGFRRRKTDKVLDTRRQIAPN